MVMDVVPVTDDELKTSPGELRERNKGRKEKVSSAPFPFEQYSLSLDRQDLQEDERTVRKIMLTSV